MKRLPLARYGTVFCLLLSLVCVSLFGFAGCSKMENVSPASDGSSETVVSEANSDNAVSAEEAEDGTEVDMANYDDTGMANDVFSDSSETKNRGVLSSNEEVEYYVPDTVKNPGNRVVTLYIWNIDQYKTKPWYYRDSLTVQKLLEGLAHETNWNLSYTDIKLNNQKITIWWDKTCSLYGGLPEKQAKDLAVFNQTDLDTAILDSVKKTLVENLGPSYTVCYANSAGGDLKLSGVGATIPANEPYSRFSDYLK